MTLHAQNLSCDSRRARLPDELRAAPGELIKIVGGNGCGKTTLLKMLCFLLPPDDGDIYWDGDNVCDDLDAYREELLYVGHQNAIADDLTPLENLRAAAALRLRSPLLPLAQALAEAGLGDKRQPCRRLSAGQRRRAALARLRAFRARLWLLDEPLVSLDANGRDIFCRWLRAHLQSGGIAIASAHDAGDWEVSTARVVHFAAADTDTVAAQAA